jgi:heparin binding hemagglutinin HbhA
MATAKFDIKTEAQRGLHAYVGAADLAIETVREYVAGAQKRLVEVQKSVQSVELTPKARREAIEKRVVDLQGEATETFDDLVKRGETVVRRFRNKPASKATVANAKTTTAKAKTARTQAKKSPAKSSAKATGTAARKTVKSATKAVTS